MQHFLLFPNSWKSSQITLPAHLPLRPPLGGRSGLYPPWGTHRSVWDAAIGKGKKEVSAGATAPVTGFSAPCHKPGAPCRNSNPPEKNVLPSTSAAASPGDTRSGQEIPVPQGQIQSWVSRKTGKKTELQNKTEQGRPNTTCAGLLPDPEVLLSLPWGRSGEEAAMTKSGTGSSALWHDGKCSFSLFDFTCLAHTPIGPVN